MGRNTKIPSGYRLVYAIKENHGSPIYGSAWSTDVHQVLTKIPVGGGPPMEETTPQDANANSSSTTNNGGTTPPTVHQKTTVVAETIDLTQDSETPQSQEVGERTRTRTSTPFSTVKEIDLTQDDADEDRVQEEVPLTLEEKVKLTQSINGLSEEHMMKVALVIEGCVKDLGDEDEVDVEMDTLDISTQRKLQRMIKEVRRVLIFLAFSTLHANTKVFILFLV